MLSAKTQYACLAAAQLAAEHDVGRPVQAARIAEQQGIPATFLVQILNELKRVGLVTSTRGAGGGYRLTDPPAETTLLDIAEALDRVEAEPPCAAPESPLAGFMEQLCSDLAQARRERLAAVTLADLARLTAADKAPMWYI